MLFLFVWRRNGLAVPFLTFGSLLLFNFILGKTYEDNVGPKIIAFLVAAAAIFAITRFTEDEGDHFFFIPLKFWAPIVAVVGIIFSFTATDAHPTSATTAVQDPAKSETAAPARQAPPRVFESSLYTPPPQPKPQPAPVARVEEPVMQVAQVYVDRTTLLYYTETCAGRPANASRLPKSVAKLQGYRPAPGCGS